MADGRMTLPRVAPEDKAFVAQLLLYLDDALDAAGVAELKRELERNEARRELYVAMCTQRWAMRESLLRSGITVVTWRKARELGSTFPASDWGMLAVASAAVGYQIKR